MTLESGIIPSLLGTGVFAGLVIWGTLNHSYLWRRVAAAYPKPDALPEARGKILESIIITKRPEPALESNDIVKRPGPTLGQKVALPYRLYAGVKLSVVDGGLLLSSLLPFNIVHSPIYLPFAEMTISPTWWAMWPEPAAIRMTLLPDTDIILGQKAAQWLYEHKT
jgi:hypothetical protein